jgi:hypothetical protein
MRFGEIEDGLQFAVRKRRIDMTQDKFAKWFIRGDETIQHV